MKEQEQRALSDEERDKILLMGKSFAEVWEGEGFPNELKKKILRSVIDEAIVNLDEAKQQLHFVIHWKGDTHTDRVFEHLSVEENLRIGAYTRGTRGNADVDRVYETFPRLREHRHRLSGFLSGGEQQMLAIGRALMAEPRLLLLDEPSLGLAPRLVEEIFDTLRRVNADEGTTMLLVEQNAARALDIAHYGYVMENGRVVLEGSPEKLRDNADVKEFYLGLSDLGERKSYRDVKRYRRRKRWLS